MDRLVPRHRRKAGSGPPASALIAWIGTDPYLREAAATARYQREIAPPLPSHTRSARMAVVVCFALTCGAVLGIMTIINHGHSAAQAKIAAPSPVTPAEAGSDPVLSAAPVGMAPMLAERAAPPSLIGPPTDQKVDQRPGDQSDASQEHVCSPTLIPSVPSGVRCPSQAGDLSPACPADLSERD